MNPRRWLMLCACLLAGAMATATDARLQIFTLHTPALAEPSTPLFYQSFPADLNDSFAVLLESIDSWDSNAAFALPSVVHGRSVGDFSLNLCELLPRILASTLVSQSVRLQI